MLVLFICLVLMVLSRNNFLNLFSCNFSSLPFLSKLSRLCIQRRPASVYMWIIASQLHRIKLLNCTFQIRSSSTKCCSWNYTVFSLCLFYDDTDVPLSTILLLILDQHDIFHVNNSFFSFVVNCWRFCLSLSPLK